MFFFFFIYFILKFEIFGASYLRIFEKKKLKQKTAVFFNYLILINYLSIHLYTQQKYYGKEKNMERVIYENAIYVLDTIRKSEKHSLEEN